jgi:hypothetical protein
MLCLYNICINLWWLRENHWSNNVSCHRKRCTTSCYSPDIFLLYALHVPRQYTDVMTTETHLSSATSKGAFSLYSSWLLWSMKYVIYIVYCVVKLVETVRIILVPFSYHSKKSTLIWPLRVFNKRIIVHDSRKKQWPTGCYVCLLIFPRNPMFFKRASGENKHDFM